MKSDYFFLIWEFHIEIWLFRKIIIFKGVGGDALCQNCNFPRISNIFLPIFDSKCPTVQHYYCSVIIVVQKEGLKVDRRAILQFSRCDASRPVKKGPTKAQGTLTADSNWCCQIELRKESMHIRNRVWIDVKIQQVS